MDKNIEEYGVVANTRVSREQKERLEKNRDNRSVSEVLREAIDVWEAVDDAFAGQAEAVKAFALSRGLHPKFERAQTVKALIEHSIGSTTTIKF